MTQGITPNQDKELSKDEALREYGIMLAGHGTELAGGPQTYEKMTFDQIYRGYKVILGKTKIFIPLLYEKGRDEGKSIEEIRSKLEELGIEYRTAMRYTPDWAKRKQLHGPRKRVDKLSTQQVNRRLVVPEEPTIPPRPDVVREAEIVREPPKPINEPIPIPKIIEVVFDPAAIDRDRTQVFIMQIDPVAKKVIKYKAVGRRSIGK